MKSQNRRTRVVFSSILGIALSFQLCAAPAAMGQYYNDGATHDVSETSLYSIWIDGEGTVVNFNAPIDGGVHVCWFSPGATLNYGADAGAFYIDVSPGSYVNLYGGSVSWVVFVSAGAEVMVHGDRFVVGGEEYDPGTTLNIGYDLVTAYDEQGELFSGFIACTSQDATVTLGTEPDDTGLNVQIDVKPGSEPSTINLGSNGLVPVALLSDGTFDATQVPPETVQFAGAAVALSGKGKYMANAADVDEDGDTDILFHFRIVDLKLDDGVTEAEVTLTGQLGGQAAEKSLSLLSAAQANDGTPISGTDNVHILRPKKKKK